MGQEPTVAGKAFLRKRAAKFVTKAPEATEALKQHHSRASTAAVRTCEATLAGREAEADAALYAEAAKVKFEKKIAAEAKASGASAPAVHGRRCRGRCRGESHARRALSCLMQSPGTVYAFEGVT